MAEFFKHSLLNSDAYPLPDEPALFPPGAPAGQQHAPQFADAEPHEVQAAASEVRQLLDVLQLLNPAVRALGEQAQEGGRERGYREGLEQAQAEIQQQVIEAMTALTDAQRARHAHAQQNAAALADLALKIATKVIGAHLEADPAIVARIVESSIAELEPTTKLVVRVNPADLAFVEDRRTELERIASGPGSIELMADEGVERGGCILVSPVGEVDARIGTKLDVLRAAFAAQRRQIDAELDA